MRCPPWDRFIPSIGVARLHGGHVDRHVGLRAGVGLDVRVVAAEELLRPVDGEALRHVDELAAAVIALARVALGVLVREDGAQGLENGFGDEVLRRDHLELRALAAGLVADGVGDLGINAGEMFHDVP